MMKFWLLCVSAIIPSANAQTTTAKAATDGVMSHVNFSCVSNNYFSIDAAASASVCHERCQGKRIIGGQPGCVQWQWNTGGFCKLYAAVTFELPGTAEEGTTCTVMPTITDLGGTVFGDQHCGPSLSDPADAVAAYPGTTSLQECADRCAAYQDQLCVQWQMHLVNGMCQLYVGEQTTPVAHSGMTCVHVTPAITTTPEPEQTTAAPTTAAPAEVATDGVMSHVNFSCVSNNYFSIDAAASASVCHERCQGKRIIGGQPGCVQWQWNTGGFCKLYAAVTFELPGYAEEGTTCTVMPTITDLGGTVFGDQHCGPSLSDPADAVAAYPGTTSLQECADRCAAYQELSCGGDVPCPHQCVQWQMHLVNGMCQLYGEQTTPVAHSGMICVHVTPSIASAITTTPDSAQSTAATSTTTTTTTTATVYSASSISANLNSDHSATISVSFGSSVVDATASSSLKLGFQYQLADGCPDSDGNAVFSSEWATHQTTYTLAHLSGTGHSGDYNLQVPETPLTTAIRWRSIVYAPRAFHTNTADGYELGERADTLTGNGVFPACWDSSPDCPYQMLSTYDGSEHYDNIRGATEAAAPVTEATNGDECMVYSASSISANLNSDHSATISVSFGSSVVDATASSSLKLGFQYQLADGCSDSDGNAVFSSEWATHQTTYTLAHLSGTGHSGDYNLQVPETPLTTAIRWRSIVYAPRAFHANTADGYELGERADTLTGNGVFPACWDSSLDCPYQMLSTYDGSEHYDNIREGTEAAAPVTEATNGNGCTTTPSSAQTTTTTAEAAITSADAATDGAMSHVNFSCASNGHFSIDAAASDLECHERCLDMRIIGGQPGCVQWQFNTNGFCRLYAAVTFEPPYVAEEGTTCTVMPAITTSSTTTTAVTPDLAQTTATTTAEVATDGVMSHVNFSCVSNNYFSIDAAASASVCHERCQGKRIIGGQPGCVQWQWNTGGFCKLYAAVTFEFPGYAEEGTTCTVMPTITDLGGTVFGDQHCGPTLSDPADAVAAYPGTTSLQECADRCAAYQDQLCVQWQMHLVNGMCQLYVGEQTTPVAHSGMTCVHVATPAATTATTAATTTTATSVAPNVSGKVAAEPVPDEDSVANDKNSGELDETPGSNSTSLQQLADDVEAEDSEQPGQAEQSSSAGAIAGGVVGALGFAAILVAVAVFRKNITSPPPTPSDASIEHGSRAVGDAAPTDEPYDQPPLLLDAATAASAGNASLYDMAASAGGASGNVNTTDYDVATVTGGNALPTVLYDQAVGDRIPPQAAWAPVDMDPHSRSFRLKSV
eukprot:gene18900-18720_t